jgi:hypothetical protein
MDRHSLVGLPKPPPVLVAESRRHLPNPLPASFTEYSGLYLRLRKRHKR